MIAASLRRDRQRRHGGAAAASSPTPISPGRSTPPTSGSSSAPASASAASPAPEQTRRHAEPRGERDRAGARRRRPPPTSTAIVLATASPDRLLPSTACDLQALLGADNAAAFDIGAACPGYIYALTVAEGLIASGQSRTVLVVGAEKLSTITDFQDRSTAILFGDGAGRVGRAPVVGSRAAGILSTFLKSDGRLAPLLYRPGGGSADPISEKVVCERSHYMKMAGREVFKAAVLAMAEACDEALTPGRRHRRRDRSADSAPGQPPDHRGHREARRHSDVQGDGQPRPLRQHLVGLDSARARPGRGGGPGRSRARCCCWSRSAPDSPGAAPSSGGDAC